MLNKIQMFDKFKMSKPGNDGRKMTCKNIFNERA